MKSGDCQTDAPVWVDSTDSDWPARRSGPDPSILALRRCPTIESAWHATRQLLSDAMVLLERRLQETTVRTVAVSGSLGRMEKTAHSDLDLIVVLEDDAAGCDVLAEAAYVQVRQSLQSLGLCAPREDGIFARPSSQATLCDPLRRGTIAEDPEVFGKRIQWLLDCQPIYGFAAYDRLFDAVLDWYAVVTGDPLRDEPAGYLINDLLRYFRAICVDCQWRGRDDPGSWRLRNLKLLHTRLVSCGALLVSLGASTRAGQKEDWLRRQLRFTPLERLARVFQLHDQGGALSRILERYERFLDFYGNPSLRAELITPGGPPEGAPSDHPLYRSLRDNANQIQDELVRFVLARHGDWSDAFFRYLIL